MHYNELPNERPPPRLGVATTVPPFVIAIRRLKWEESHAGIWIDGLEGQIAHLEAQLDDVETRLKETAARLDHLLGEIDHSTP